LNSVKRFKHRPRGKLARQHKRKNIFTFHFSILTPKMTYG
jgi:hypothetical protein